MWNRESGAVLYLLQYDATRMEKLIFSSPNYNNHLCLVHDYSTDPTQMLKGQQEAADWMGIISHISRYVCGCVRACVRACVCMLLSWSSDWLVTVTWHATCRNSWRQSCAKLLWSIYKFKKVVWCAHSFLRSFVTLTSVRFGQLLCWLST